jgi:hypothetical protein
MADPPRYPDAGGNAGSGHDPESTTGTPRWVKVSGIIALALVLLFVIVMLTGGGHGPGRHTLSDGGPGGQTSPSSVTEHAMQQP